MIGPRQVVMTFADTKIPARVQDCSDALTYLFCQQCLNFLRNVEVNGLGQSVPALPESDELQITP